MSQLGTSVSGKNRFCGGQRPCRQTDHGWPVLLSMPPRPPLKVTAKFEAGTRRSTCTTGTPVDHPNWGLTGSDSGKNRPKTRGMGPATGRAYLRAGFEPLFCAGWRPRPPKRLGDFCSPRSLVGTRWQFVVPLGVWPWVRAPRRRERPSMASRCERL